MDDLGLLEIIGIIGVLALLLWPRGRKKQRGVRRSGRRDKIPVDQSAAPPANAIVVDGSNVLHWGTDPSVKVLSQVLRSLERAGHVPIVFFDASVGYVLDDHYYDEARLADLIGISASHVCVVDKGVVADEAILSFATDYGLRVVTNDRFRDWRDRFPHAARKNALLSGSWREGTVVWRGKLGSQIVGAKRKRLAEPSVQVDGPR